MIQSLARVFGKRGDEKALPIILEQLFSVAMVVCRFLPQGILAGSVRFLVRLTAVKDLLREKESKRRQAFLAL